MERFELCHIPPAKESGWKVENKFSRHFWTISRQVSEVWAASVPRVTTVLYLRPDIFVSMNS